MNLKQAYLNTDYQVRLSPTQTLHIRAEQPNPKLDAYLKELQTWAYLTAWNPDSQPLPTKKNTQRNQQLEKELQVQNYPYFHGEGVPDNSNWLPEASFWILGISKRAAIAFGKKWEQRAIVWGQRGKVAELLPCLRKGFGD
ncbi:MAG: DUF3293 domain-containing protein [Bacteroidota bacterium]